ncbi:MAG TPA: glycosyltransferase family 87 protein [Erythrobacter sp.]|nr:glycosyltransferase family 87 protein [Erythrobacter sp.]
MLPIAKKITPQFAARFFAFGFGFAIALALFANVTNLRRMDFMSFWAAGKLTLAGKATDAFDIAVHHQVQAAVVDFEGLMPFAYPPPFLLVVTPFALLPYAVAAIVWTALTYALYIIGARRFAPSAGWTAAAFPPVLVNGIIAQNGLLTGGLFVAGMTLLQRHPVWAGLVLGCLVIKPHLAVLFPLALAAGGHWRAFAGAAASSVGLAVIALLAFGIGAYQAFIDQMPLFSSIAAEGLVGWHKMASIYASLRLAGAGPAAAWSAHILIACMAAIAMGLVWRSGAEIEAKAAMLAAASVLISPYIYLYDTVLLVLPFVWLARNGEDPRVLAALWCIPLIVALQNWGLNETVNPAPLLPVAMAILIWRRLQERRIDARAQAPLPTI